MYDQRCLDKVKRKHKAFKKFRSTKSTYDWKQFKVARNICKVSVREAKRSFEKKLATECKVNPKSFWKYVKSKTKVRTGICPLGGEKGQLFSTDKGKAETLN
ncbi:MAG: hypothetical protein MJA29_09315, partial [Candidatus Omnitrophica bacterium]|nr:hypothetical protein [Candidatus Omnitrophota bacterium]